MTIIDRIGYIRTHADVLMKVPANEQNIGNIQSIISIAISDIAQCLELLNQMIRDKADREWRA